MGEVSRTEVEPVCGTDPQGIERLRELGVLQDIDRIFAETLRRLLPEEPPSVLLAAALASRAVQSGHVCLDVEELSAHPFLAGEEATVRIELPGVARWIEELSQSALVGDGSTPTPLVLTRSVPGSHRLYLSRYAQYERRLAEALSGLWKEPVDLDESFLIERFRSWFDPSQDRDPQRLAVFVAMRRRLAIISGGPGTGKTTTVTKLLLLLQEHALRQGRALHIDLLAPTGKAAQRLNESIAGTVQTLGVEPRLRECLPKEASTIHRALGYQSRTPTRFYRNRARPLASDVVIVDEASMVDLALMTKLVEALAPGGRLILLGDRDQLASVEAGAIFGDICSLGRVGEYSRELVEQARRVSGEQLPAAESTPSIADVMVHLDKSYRYKDDSGIGRLAASLRRVDSVAREVLHAFDGSAASFVSTKELDAEAVRRKIRRLLLQGYDALARSREPRERLVALGGFRLLSPHRRGPLGVSELNALAEAALRDAALLDPRGEQYDGRPILITENDYQLGLFNGDVGIIGWNERGRLVGYFEAPDGVRSVQVSRLPAHETVFAMTVHKSQGSEFDEVALVLPPEPSPILTRELLYTGVTRARRHVTVFGTEDVLRVGVETRIRRASGLPERLVEGASVSPKRVVVP